jgi:kynureninase
MDVNRGGHGADQRAAVRSAEQAVSDAWVGQLVAAEYEAQVAAGICTRVRERLAERLRVALREGDTDAMEETSRRLECADRVCAAALDTYSEARAVLAEQLEDWLRATRVRYREAEDDRRVVGW